MLTAAYCDCPSGFANGTTPGVHNWPLSDATKPPECPKVSDALGNKVPFGTEVRFQ